MSFDLTTSLTFEIKDGTIRVAYGASALAAEDHDEFHTGGMQVVNGAAGLAVSLGPLTTVEALYLESDELITLTLNGSDTPLAGTCFYLAGAAITSIAVSNDSGEQATLRYVMAGT